MSKNNNRNNKPPKRERSPQERFKIRQYYINKSRQQKAKPQEQRVEAPFPHFRYYKKSGHPALIVGEQVNPENIEEYRYRKVMHSEKDGKRNNEPVIPNPKPGDPEPMYIGKRVRHDIKDNFEPRPLPWQYPKKDK